MPSRIEYRVDIAGSRVGKLALNWVVLQQYVDRVQLLVNLVVMG